MKDRWELGSELQFPRCLNSEHAAMPWSEREHRLYGCGRDAFISLLNAQPGIVRLRIPDYFCQEVAESIGRYCEIDTYPALPGSPLDLSSPIKSRDPRASTLVVNTFGLYERPHYPKGPGPLLIEDHTHDPFSAWAANSEADFVVASLRKCLPLPDGAVLWSPKGHPLPDEPELTAEREYSAYLKLAGMVLKSAYLDGFSIEKTSFRELSLRGEGEIATGKISAMSPFSRSLLRALPVHHWREQRMKNFRAFSDAAKGGSFQVLAPQGTATPFSCILYFESQEVRDAARKKLISNNIFPAILWPYDSPALSPAGSPALDFSKRMLSIHCDHRYLERDMEKVASCLSS